MGRLPEGLSSGVVGTDDPSEVVGSVPSSRLVEAALTLFLAESSLSWSGTALLSAVVVVPVVVPLVGARVELVGTTGCWAATKGLRGPSVIDIEGLLGVGIGKCCGLPESRYCSCLLLGGSKSTLP